MLRLVTEICSIFKTITQLLFANTIRVQVRSPAPLCQHAVQYVLDTDFSARIWCTDTAEQTTCHFK